MGKGVKQKIVVCEQIVTCEKSTNRKATTSSQTQGVKQSQKDTFASSNPFNITDKASSDSKYEREITITAPHGVTPNIGYDGRFSGIKYDACNLTPEAGNSIDSNVLHIEKRNENGKTTYTISTKKGFGGDIKIKADDQIYTVPTNKDNPYRSTQTEAPENKTVTPPVEKPEEKNEEPQECLQFLTETEKSNLCKLELTGYKGTYYEYTETDGSKSLIYSGDKDLPPQVLRYGSSKWDKELSEAQKESLNYTQRLRAEKILADKLDLKKTHGDEAYTRDGFEGKFYIQVEPRFELTSDLSSTIEDVANKKFSVFYEGGKDSKGEEVPPQTYHDGTWDKKRDKSLGTLGERLVESLESTAGKFTDIIADVVQEVPKALEEKVESAINTVNELAETAKRLQEKEIREAKEVKEFLEKQLDTNFKNPPLVVFGTSGKLPTMGIPFSIKFPGSNEFIPIQNKFGQGFNGLRISSDGSYDATNAEKFGAYTIKVLDKEYTFNIEPKLPEKVRIKPGESYSLNIPAGVTISAKVQDASVFKNIDKTVEFVADLKISKDGTVSDTKYASGIHTIKTAGGQEVKVVIEDDLNLPQRVEPGQKIKLPFPENSKVYILPRGGKQYNEITKEGFQCVSGADVKANGEFTVPAKYAEGTYKFKTEGGQEASVVVEPSVNSNDVPQRVQPGVEVKLPVPEGTKFSIKGPEDKEFQAVDKSVPLQKGFINPDGSFKTIKSGKYTIQTEGGQEFSFVVEPNIQTPKSIVEPDAAYKLPIPKGVKFSIKGPGDEDFIQVDKRRKLESGLVLSNGTFRSSKIGKYKVKTEGGQEFEFTVEPNLNLPKTIEEGSGNLNLPKGLKFSIRMPEGKVDVKIDKPFTGAGGFVINPDGTYSAPRSYIGETITIKTEGGQESNVTILPKPFPQPPQIQEIGFGEAKKELEQLKETILRNCNEDEVNDKTKKLLYEYLRDYSQSIFMHLQNSMALDSSYMFDIWGKHFKDEAVKFAELARSLSN